MTTPTPTPLKTPPTMRVTVAIGYVRSCARCRELVGQLQASCLGDPTVQSITAQPGREHACGAMAEPKPSRTALALATAQPAHTPGPPLPFTGALDAATGLPISDTNGSDFDAVANHDEALFNTGPSAGESDPG